MKKYIGILLFIMVASLATDVQAKHRKQKPVAAAKKKKPAKKETKKEAAKEKILVTGGNDTTIKSTTLEVYQVYKPEIKQAPKPEFLPTLPPPPTQRITQEYEVPQQTLYYSYRSMPLHPLALGRDTTPLPFANYIKLGGGNLSTFLGDIGIGSLKGKNWETAIHAKHISQESDIIGQQFQHTQLGVEGTLHSNGNAFTAAVDADYKKYGLYGYDHAIYHYNESDIAQKYGSGAVSFGMQNERDGLWGMNYHPVISASFIAGTALSNEHTIDLNLPFSRKIDDHLSADLGFHGVLTQFKKDSFSRSNNLFQITPALRFQQDNFWGHIGLNPTFGQGGIAYLLPDINAGVSFLENHAAISAGWQANLIQNTFAQLIAKNPFMDAVPTAQTKTNEVYGQLKAHIGNHFSFNGRLSWWQYNNLPMFITSYPGDGKSFTTIYDPNVRAIALQASARYQVAELFSIGVNGTWTDFYHKTYAHVWQEPGVRLKADAQWHPVKQLTITAYSSVLDQIYAPDEKNISQKLSGVFDLGFGAEYAIIPRLSLFMNVDNLLDRHNVRWLGYSSFGLNVYGGIRFRF